MKTFTLTFIFLLILSVQSLFAQKVVVIGLNHETPDGFSFVATENIPVSEVIYFTDNEYSDVANAFTFNGQATGEAVIVFTVTSALSAGDVVFVKEVSSNTFTVTSSGGTGTAVISSEPNQSFNLSTNGDGLYAYSDTDEIPTNGITQIYSVLYTGSGEAPVQNGGTIPSDQNPVSDYPNAVVVDGFPDDANDLAGPIRVEYKFSPATERNAVSQTALENPNNYLSYVTAQDLSVVPFTNINLSGSNPVLTVSASPASLYENSGSSITYTFSLSANAGSNITVNFSVGGTATFTTDYTQSGAASFNASSGTVTIATGTSSAAVTVSPVGDASLEPNETVILTLTAGTGYDAGSPSAATGTILNDDTQSVTPLVAVTGINQNDPEGFSFVALDDIASGTVVYFTENSLDKNTLAFTGSEAVLSWTAPVAGVLRGEVIVVKENPANTFTTSSNSGNSGTISLLIGPMSFATTGEGFYAYTDGDNNPSNGITEVHSVLYTGNSTTSGGNIPVAEDPSTVYTGAVVVDGFAATAPDRTEYDPSKRNVTVDNANFQNVSNWLHSQTNQDLSVVPFSNIIITMGSPNPTLTLAVSPSDVIEDSGDTLFYTFTLSAPASGDITVNFDVAGTADFSTDYTVDGAASFTASAGSIVIADGSSSAVLAVIPTADSDVETQESVQLTIASGTGYDGGSPNDASGTISNDDTSASDPLVALTGLNHIDPDGFSFVAAQDIMPGTKIYFTDNSFNKNTLMFSTGEAVLSWTSPASIVPAGQVLVVTETSADVFAITRSNGSAETGSISLESGNFALATDGETFYAYKDNDNDPSNGVEDIYSALFTGVVGTSGGTIPTDEDPSGIYIQALIVDGFAATAPNRTEYDPTKRNVLVDDVDFENISNWLFAQANQTLSTVPFDSLNIVIDYNTDPSITGLPTDITVTEDQASNVDLSAATFTDDAGAYSVTLTLTVGKGILTAISGGSVTVGGSGSMTLSLVGTPSNIDNYLNTATNLQYTGDPDEYGNDVTTLSLVANDGGNTGLGGGLDVNLGTVNIDITNVNDAPVVTTSVGTITYTENDPPVIIDTAISVTDIDNVTLASATVAISNNFQAGSDVLSFANDGSTMGNIAGSYNAGTGVLTLTSSGSTATVAQWQNALRAVSYSNSSDTLAANNRTIAFTVNDGTDDSNTGTKTISVIAVNDDPTATGLPVDLNVVEDVSSGLDLSGISFSDVDIQSGNLTLLLSVMDGYFALSNPAPNSLTVSGNGTTNITLLGTISNLETYLSTPTNTSYYSALNKNGIGSDTLIILLNDNGNSGTGGGADVLIGKIPVNITPVNDAPVVENVFGNNSTEIAEGAGAKPITDLTDATVSDVDSPDMNGGFITLTQSSGTTNGSFGVDGTNVTAGGDAVIAAGETVAVGGVSVGTVHATNDGQGGNSLRIDFNANSTLANIQTLIRNLTYSAPSVIDSRTFTLTLNDGDGTANGGSDQIAGNFTISIIPFVPDIALKTGGNYINIGDTVDFGDIELGLNQDTTIRILNEGNNILNLYSIFQGPVNFQLNLAGINANVNPSDSTSFRISYTPSQIGEKIDHFALSSNDPDESNYSFFVRANGVDNSPPTAVCQNDTIWLDINGDATVTPAEIDNGSSDISGIDSMWLDKYAFSCADLGDNEVTLYVSDMNGNMDSCQSVVTVMDTITPVAVCQNISVYLDETGMALISASDLENGSTDNCGIDTMWLNQYDFACADIGDNNVTLFVRDASGNTDSCAAMVSVADTIKPVAVCKNISVALDQNGKATITAAQIDGGSTDNCSIATMWLDRYNFTSADVGTKLVTLFVADASGNQSSCTASVKIGDNIPPIVQCNSISINLDSNGGHTFTASEIKALSAGSTDNVTAPANLVITAKLITGTIQCANDGIYVRADVTATDQSKNSSTCSVWVKVLNGFELAVEHVEDVVVAAPAGACETMVDYPELKTLSKCAEFTQISGLGPDGIFPVGTTEEVWMIHNSRGDSLEFSFTVTVTGENLPPTLNSIPDIDTTGQVSELLVSLSGISSGAGCASQTLSVSATGINSEVISNIMLDYTYPDSTVQLSLEVAPGANGKDTITVTVETSGGATFSRTFVVSVHNDTTPPEPDYEVIADRDLIIPLDSLFDNGNTDSVMYDVMLEDGSELPDWIYITDDTLYVQPTIEDTGCFSVVINATDTDMTTVSDTLSICVLDYPVGISDFIANDMSLNMYPNPSRGLVTFEFESPVYGDIELQVFNLAGRRIIQKTFMAAQQIDINLSDQVSGMYLVNVQVDGQRFMKKLILNKE